ncbi:nuclear transport factor 2 family protein [Flavobacterium sp.]|uniref:nuclear transport factor 2 family protein n=1 Tax=Flavobacterium sp. TaxID=239 RepID=UPI0037511F8B
MNAKEVVKNFYQSDALRNSELMDTFIHPDITLEWNSSKGFLLLNRKELLKLGDELKKAYHSSRVEINHLLADENIVTVRYTHHIKTIENSGEEMVLAHFIVIWELKDDKLYRGYQMSQLS